MSTEDLFLTVPNAIREFISITSVVYLRKKFKFLRKIFKFNILKWKWLRLLKQMIQSYDVHTFYKVGINSFSEGFLE